MFPYLTRKKFLISLLEDKFKLIINLKMELSLNNRFQSIQMHTCLFMKESKKMKEFEEIQSFQMMMNNTIKFQKKFKTSLISQI